MLTNIIIFCIRALLSLGKKGITQEKLKKKVQSLRANKGWLSWLHRLWMIYAMVQLASSDTVTWHFPPDIMVLSTMIWVLQACRHYSTLIRSSELP